MKIRGTDEKVEQEMKKTRSTKSRVTFDREKSIGESIDNIQVFSTAKRKKEK